MINPNYEGVEDTEESPLPPQRKDERESPEIGVIRELSPKKVLEQLRMNLKGFFYDWETKKYVKVEGFEPLMNDKGISKYLSICSAVVTDLVTFSNYNENEIPKLTYFVCENAIPIIYVNYKEFGIKQKSDLPILTNQVFNLTLAAFKKAIGAGDRGVIGRTITENIQSKSGIIQPLRNEKEGFFGRFLRR